MQKIYFDKKVLILCENVEECPKQASLQEGAIHLKGNDEMVLEKALSLLEQPDISTVMIQSESSVSMLNELKTFFTVIEAGGGFVYTDSQKLLFIFRRGKWDLPKGKLDDGETIEECSLREVTEETGLEPLQLEAPLLTTYHTYPDKEKIVLKESHWFLMKAAEQVALTPQTAEDIESCEWVPFQNMSVQLSNTHGSIKDVVEAGIKQLTF